MKLIPKYQNPFSPLTLSEDWTDNIIWDTDPNHYYARDKNGSPLSSIIRYSFGSNPNQKKNNWYDYSRNGVIYEDQPWYQNYRNLLFTYDDNKNVTGLTPLGEAHTKQWYTNSPSSIGYKENIGQYLQNHNFWGFNVGKKHYNNIQDWLSHSTSDKLNGQNHNTPSGDIYYWYDENGNIQTGNSIPDGYVEYTTTNPGDSELYENEQEELKKLGGLGELVTWRKLVKDDQNDIPYNYTNPFGKDLGEVDWNINSNDPRISKIQEAQKKKSPVGAEDPGVSNNSWLNKLIQSLGLKRKPGDTNSSNKNNSNLISPAWMQGLRIAADNAFNTINTENLISDMDVPLANYTPIYRQVHGDYIAQQQAQREASRLRSSQPVTANQQIQSAVDLEGIEKGNRIIEQGNARDAQMFWNTSEQAFQQAKENVRGWDSIANLNRQKLAEFTNKIAELRFNTRKQNMQNWDTFATDMEKRAWQKYDLEEYKRQVAQEELDTLYDQRNGIADKLLEQQQLYDDIEDESLKATPDTTRLAELKKKYRDISKLIIAQQYYNKLNRLGLYNEESFRQMFPGFKLDNNLGIISAIGTNRNGGILRRLLQQGGAFGVVSGSSAGPGNPYLAGTSSKGTTSSSRSSSTKSDDDDTKTRDKLLSNIAETLKGIDGLNSDVNILYKELVNFFDIQKYNPTSDDPMQFYSMYVRALNRVNQVKQSAKQFDNAYKALEKTGSITSPAIDANGLVYVGVADTNEVTKIKPQDYLANPSKYHLLRNNELLELRKNHPEYSFSDNFITETAYNGTSIQEIHKYVKDILGKVGTDKQSQDILVRQYGAGAVQGLQTLAQLAQGQLTSSETAAIIGGLTGALTEMNVTTQTQAEQAKLALNTIKAMLPANMRSLLLLHAGSEEDVEKMLVSFVAKGLDTTIEFKIDDITQLDENGLPKSGSKSGSGSGSDKETKESTATKLAQGYGQKTTFQIVGGSNKAWTVTGNTLPITNSEDKSIGQTLLSDASTAFGGMLDLRHAFMGNSRISSLGLSQVLLEDGDITMVALPIDESAGYKRPAFNRLKSTSEADRELKELGIDITNRTGLTLEQKRKINEIYQKHSLPEIFNNDGSLNELKFGYFGLVKGIAKETAFEEGNEFTRDYLIEATKQERELFEQIMKLKGNKDFKLRDSWLGKDEVYRGTIFIPLNTNIINTQSGYGSSYAGTPGQDMQLDILQQKHDAIAEKGGLKPIGKTNFSIQ